MTSANPSPRPPRVLIAEDDDVLRTTVATHLAAAGCDVVEAGDGVQAWEIASRREGQIEALVADVLMPHIGGAELARRMREGSPRLAVLLVSGHFRGIDVAGWGGLSGVSFLGKPFSPAALELRLRAMVANWPAHANVTW